MNHPQYNQLFNLLGDIQLPIDPQFMKLNELCHSSAFAPIIKDEEQPRSFIQIRDLPKHENISSLSHRSSALHRKQSEDSDSTHHSHESPKSQPKESKEQKRKNNLKSIMRLIQSRKVDTLQELSHLNDDDIILQRSPKPISKNSKLSHFRGVSHNGRKWQVMIMGFAKKIYFGGISSEDEASHKYDKYAILMHGLEAKTNYNYSKRELCQILNSDVELD
ncbi:unnamed protein product [Moneuplotes crassus]|uniref:AP2/ERF domain-containing protein n=1 Tax=Euplotes crassus TaxID=5936 RepID=A0AAD1XQU5_EUPCR|nr:unnamed protein product [Moneuplotes crassus]